MDGVRVVVVGFVDVVTGASGKTGDSNDSNDTADDVPSMKDKSGDRERELIKWSWREGELAGVNEVINVHVVDMEVLCSHIVGVRELTGFARRVAYHEGGLAGENTIKQRMI